MKNLFTLLFIISFLSTTSSQIVINEISYNPPEAGTDSLEYIELYNAGNSMVDLNNYSMQGVTHTFNQIDLLPGDYLVIAKSAQAMQIIFGINVIQWENGALQNGGEMIALLDDNGNVIDQLDYMDVVPWPTSMDGTDSEGASIELCDASNDNSLGSNWRASTNDIGIIVNGKFILGTPGTANSVTCTVTPNHIVTLSGISFTPKDITINIGETVRWDNVEGVHNVNGSLGSYPNNPAEIFSGAAAPAPWTFDFTFNLTGLYNYHCDPHLSVGMTGTVTVIDPNAPNFPSYDIATVTSVNANGVGDSLTTTCELTGVVHSINFRPGGLTFALIDANNDGINVFDSNSNFGYNVEMGDMLSVKGEIGQFRGLLQIEPSSIDVLSSGNNLFDPTIVNILDESTESQLIQIVNLNYVDGSEWLGDGSDFNVNLTDGTQTYAARIDADTDLSSSARIDCTDGQLSFIGIGGQFDFNDPLTDGYQIFPRNLNDILCLTKVEDLSEEGDISISPNPVQNVININTLVEIDHVVIRNSLGKEVLRFNFEKSFDLSQLSTGSYFISFIRANKIYTRGFIKL